MGTFFIECIIIFIYYDFFYFCLTLYFYIIIFWVFWHFFCDLCIAHTDFLFSYILYILIESIDNCCWYMVYREDFFHTYFFYDFTIIFYLSTFFLHPLLGSTHPSGANCQTLREQSCSIPNCNGWTKTKKIPQTYNSDNSSATGSWKRND